MIVADYKGDLKRFYDDSSLTIEGLKTDWDTLTQFAEWIKGITPFKVGKEKLYIITGKQMNDAYGLTGNNRYNDDLDIVIAMLCDLKEPMRLALPRFQIGGRWFDDVVDNNLRREQK